MIMETECVRFAKLGDFSKNLEDFLQNYYKSHQNIDVWKGQSPFQSPIAAKLLEASGEAASFIYYNIMFALFSTLLFIIEMYILLRVLKLQRG